MNPSTSSALSGPQAPKPQRSPTLAHLPEAPPSYYDFPPAYTASSDTITDELPAYCPRDANQLQNHRTPQNRIPNTDPNRDDIPAHRIYTVMPRQAYAIHMSRQLRNPTVRENIRRYHYRQLLMGTLFLLITFSILVFIWANSTF